MPFDFLNTITPPPGGSWSEVGSATISKTTQGTISAPASVYLEATSLTGFDTSSGTPYNPQYRDCTYVWHVRGDPLPAYTKPQNMPTTDGGIYTDPNYMFGREVAFCLPDAGTYDIDLFIYEPGSGKSSPLSGAGVLSTQVVVAAPSFTAANTIVYAGDADFTGAPSSTTQVSSLSALQSAINGRSSPTRVSFKPGETISAFRMYLDSSTNIQYVDTWTQGSKVVLECMDRDTNFGGFTWDFDTNNPQAQMTFRDLDMRGGWDPTTETGQNGSGSFSFNRNLNFINITIFDCLFSGFTYVDIILLDGPGFTSSRLMIADCAVDGWQGFAIAAFPILPQGCRATYSIQGCRMAQPVNALHGGGKTSLQNDHQCFRIANARHIHFACNDCFGIGGWFGGPPADANATVRLHSTVDADASTVMERNVLEGGFLLIKMDNQNGSDLDRGGNHLIENNIGIGSTRLFSFIEGHWGGTIWRNNLFYVANIDMFQGAVYDMYQVDVDNPDATNDEPFSFYGNTFVSREATNRAPTNAVDGTYFTTYVKENNILYRAGDTSQGPLDFTTLITGVQARSNQVRYNYRVAQYTVGAAAANGGSVLIPYADIPRDTGFTHPTMNTGPGGLTDQSYWDTAVANGNNSHGLRAGPNVFFSERGDFTVTPEATGLRITNTHPSTDLDAGTWEINWDRRHWQAIELPPDTTSSYFYTDVPVCRPQAGSSALNGATTGLVPLFSLLAPKTERDSTPNVGAVE